MLPPKEGTNAFMDVNPATPGHLLVVPKRHSVDVFDITLDELTSVTMTAQRVAQHARAELNVEGVNVLNCSGAVAWQSVLHFHLHLIPRYSAKDKDGLTVPW